MPTQFGVFFTKTLVWSVCTFIFICWWYLAIHKRISLSFKARRVLNDRLANFLFECVSKDSNGTKRPCIFLCRNGKYCSRSVNIKEVSFAWSSLRRTLGGKAANGLFIYFSKDYRNIFGDARVFFKWTQGENSGSTHKTRHLNPSPWKCYSLVGEWGTN